jgi:hypothetical protein
VRLNPELRRNLWLELTPTRLVAMPAILFGLFFLTFIADDYALGTGTGAVAFVLLGGLTWLWGAQLAAESLLSELRGRTWDWQRMSGIGPWPLAWGKLAGSTVYPWYGAVLCLAVLTLARHGSEARPGITAANLVLGGLLAQTLALLASIQAARRDRTVTRGQATAWLLFAVLVLYPLLTAGYSVKRVVWYGRELAPPDFALGSVALFLAFAIVGLWVEVRRELRVRTLPLAWPAFVAVLLAWVAGFPFGGSSDPSHPVPVALAVAAPLTWVTAFAERKDPVALRRLARALRAGSWRRAAEEVPTWLLTLPFTVGLVLALLVDPSQAGAPERFAVRGFLVAGLAFFVRDVALLHYLNLGARPRRADLFAAVLLLVGYVLVPLIFGAAKLDGAIAVLLPHPGHAGVSVASALLQAGGMVALLARRWRARERAVVASAPSEG